VGIPISDTEPVIVSDTVEDELISALPLSSTHSTVEMLHDSALYKFMIDIDTDIDIDLKYVLALPWEIRSVRLSRQRNNYMYILMNHWTATNTTGSSSLKNRQTCSKSHHLYTTHAIVNRVEVRRVRQPERGWDKIWRLLRQQSYCVFGTMWWGTVLLRDEKLASKCRMNVMECVSGASLLYQNLGCRRTETTHRERVGRSESRWRVVPATERLRSHWRRTFRCKDDVTYYTFDDFWETITAGRGSLRTNLQVLKARSDTARRRTSNRRTYVRQRTANPMHRYVNDMQI